MFFASHTAMHNGEARPKPRNGSLGRTSPTVAVSRRPAAVSARSVKPNFRGGVILAPPLILASTPVRWLPGVGQRMDAGRYVSSVGCIGG